MQPSTLLRLGLLAILLISSCLAAEPDALLLIPPKYASNEHDARAWQFTVLSLLKEQLETITNLHILPRSARNYSFRALKLEPDSELTLPTIARLATTVSAKRAIFGSFSRSQNQWTLELQVWSTSNRSSKMVTASSTNLSSAIHLAAEKLLDTIGAEPTATEKTNMLRLVTGSTEALKNLGHAGVKIHDGALSDAVEPLRQAIAVEPNLLSARNLLAYCLAYQDRADEAREIAKTTVKVYPENASAHLTLGIVCFLSNLYTVAREELEEAVRLSPNEVEAYTRLAEICLRNRDWSEAISALKKAEELAPFQADIHAHLGLTYAQLDRRRRARAELSTSQSLADESDLTVSQFLAYGYDALDDAPQAIDFYEKFLAAASQTGIRIDVIHNAQRRVQYLKLRLTPKAFRTAPPQTFTPEQLQTFLKRRLSPDENALIRNPLSITPKMEAVARKVMSRGTNDFEKARLLFSWMTNRVDVDGLAHTRTAVQVFESWANRTTALHCQDYTYLYIVLARAARVKAHLASVTINYSGRMVSHVCPAVFIEDQVFLVDPAYNWFGVPHREFEVEDDLEVIGGFMAQLNDTALENVGLKLVGKWIAPYFWVFQHRLNRNETDAAFQTIREVISLDRSSCYGIYAQALLAEHQERWRDAADHWKRCLEIRPEFNDAHIGFARAFAEQGNLVAAREQWQLYLQGYTDPKVAAQVREAIASADERLAIQAEED